MSKQHGTKGCCWGGGRSQRERERERKAKHSNGTVEECTRQRQRQAAHLSAAHHFEGSLRTQHRDCVRVSAPKSRSRPERIATPPENSFGPRPARKRCPSGNIFTATSHGNPPPGPGRGRMLQISSAPPSVKRTRGRETKRREREGWRESSRFEEIQRSL